MSKEVLDRIQKEIKSHRVVIFVKGTPSAPQCGFSAATMELFEKMNVPFHSIDVIAEPAIREALPEISKWPTFPQIFIDGNLIGGSDIVHEMHESGELERLLKK
jgi:monothiol glutaredoxin